jgi:hypothetical protein
MRRVWGFFVCVVMLAAALAPAAAQTPRTYPEMKKSVAVQRFADGRVLASSAPFAVVEHNSRYTNGGSSSTTASVLVEAAPDKAVEIWFMASTEFPLFQTEVEGRDEPSNPQKVIEAHIGPPWAPTTARLLENSVTCTSDARWCRWTRHYRIDVSQDLLREIVADPERRKISMGVGRGAFAQWTVPRDHLVATVDAIGLLHAFK